MKILIIGQCTLHWGRMEYGNIGNYYIAEPFIRELHRVFPSAEILTTMQMTSEFCRKEKLTVLPMNLYYAWNDDDLNIALKELALAQLFAGTGVLLEGTPYIAAVKEADLVIDLSGDMWSDNADLAGKNRFVVGLIKDRVAQLLGKPTAMLCGSPGPFESTNLLEFTKEVYAGFDLVTNRERVSRGILESYGFDLSKTVDLACPSFLFEAANDDEIKDKCPVPLRAEQRDKPIIGFILCGWNFVKPPFSLWPRDNDEYANFVTAINHIIMNLNAQVVLMSHSNGFTPPPADFTLINGRDYCVVEQLYSILEPDIKKNVTLVCEILLPAETKAIVGQFDMLVSGRVHGAIAGISQSIPTVIIDYGHEPKAHKLKGFADLSGVGDYVCDPANAMDIIDKIDKCWANRSVITQELSQRNIEVAELARQNFDALKQIVKEG